MLSNRPLSWRAFGALSLWLTGMTAACTVEQNFGGGSASSAAGAGVTSPSGSQAGSGGIAPDPAAARSWQWLNPAQGGAVLRAVWATSSHDVWYVGEQGTVIHWDGVRASKPYASRGDETFYSVWASDANDVWIAGDRGAGTPNIVLHWDGVTWSSDFSLAVQRVHSLWGIDARHVFALTNPWPSGSLPVHGEVWWWNGQEWLLWGKRGQALPAGCGTCPETGCSGTCLDDAQNPGLLRDAWGADSHHIWVVGDAGTLAQLSVDNPDALTRAPAAVGSPVDPFDPNLDYIGVWGSAVDDVWALFVQHQQSLDRTPGAMGLAHWDGQAWSAQPNAYSLASIYGYDASVPYVPTVPAEPLRRGHLLFGLGANTVVQIAGHLFYQDASLFNGEPYAAQPSNSLAWSNVLGLGGDGKALYAAGEAGAALEWRNSDANLPWSGTWDKSPQLDFGAVAPVGENEAFGAAGQVLAHWTGSSWSKQDVDTSALPVSVMPASFTAIAASSPRDVWAVGSGAVAHFDGTAWTALPITSPDVPGITPNLQSVWVANPKDAWAVGAGGNYYANWVFLFHWDGASWNEVLSQPVIALYTSPVSQARGVSASVSVFGLSASEVWIVAYATDPGQMIWRWDGQSLEPVTDFPSDGAASLIWGSSSSDLWTAPPASLWTAPAPILHFDGTSWAQVATNADIPISVLSGTASNDVWMIAARGDESRIRSFDGRIFTAVLSSPLPLSAMSRGPDGQLWAVGKSGATLRLPALSASGLR